jgi:3-hydroxyacyl-CoA dehydrogenase
MSIGPFVLMDEIGLDTIQKITVYWAKALNDPAARTASSFSRKVNFSGLLRCQD